MSGRRLFCLLGALALGLGLLTAPVAASGVQRPDAEFPNLPERQNRTYGQLTPIVSSSYATNVALVPGAQQWVRSVDLKIAADVALIALGPPPGSPGGGDRGVANCRALYGQDSARCVRDGPVPNGKNPIRVLAYPTDFVGDDPAIAAGGDRSQMRRFDARFDRFVSQRIRALAFGAVPTEVTMDLSLATDAAGLPRAIELIGDNWLSPARNIVSDTVGRAEVVVGLRDLRVDGRRVELGPACRVTGQLTLRGRGYRLTGGNLNIVPPGRYNPRIGGTLDGQLAVGSFASCGERSENLGPLIDSFAGDANIPIRATQGPVSGQCFTDNVGQPILESRCATGGPGQFPEGTDLPTLPEDDTVPPAPSFD